MNLNAKEQAIVDRYKSWLSRSGHRWVLMWGGPPPIDRGALFNLGADAWMTADAVAIERHADCASLLAEIASGNRYVGEGETADNLRDDAMTALKHAGYERTEP